MKIKLLLAAFMMAVLTSCSDGVVTAFSTGELVTPDHSYEIDTWGTNSEIYEFTPKNDPTATCVFVMLDSGNDMGLHCFKK
jgi:hypothetical protein